MSGNMYKSIALNFYDLTKWLERHHGGAVAAYIQNRALLCVPLYSIARQAACHVITPLHTFPV